MELLGVLLIAGVWGAYVRYPDSVRKVLFWSMTVISGLLVVAVLILGGGLIGPGEIFVVVTVLGAGALGFWLAECYPRYLEAHLERRKVISVWEDAVLLLDCFIVWGGLCLLDRWMDRML